MRGLVRHGSNHPAPFVLHAAQWAVHEGPTDGRPDPPLDRLEEVVDMRGGAPGCLASTPTYLPIDVKAPVDVNPFMGHPQPMHRLQSIANPIMARFNP